MKEMDNVKETEFNRTELIKKESSTFDINNILHFMKK